MADPDGTPNFFGQVFFEVFNDGMLTDRTRPRFDEAAHDGTEERKWQNATATKNLLFAGQVNRLAGNRAAFFNPLDGSDTSFPLHRWSAYGVKHGLKCLFAKQGTQQGHVHCTPHLPVDLRELRLTFTVAFLAELERARCPPPPPPPHR